MLFAELRMGREVQEVQEGVQADSYDSALQPLTSWGTQLGVAGPQFNI